MTKDQISKADVPVVILCGGLGTRLGEAMERVPKPLVDIGGKPILWHVMKLYSWHGFRRFILALGYGSSDIKNYFLRYRENLADFTLNLKDEHRPLYLNVQGDEDWEVTCIETGLLTGTGARVHHVSRYMDLELFALTYADGIGTCDLSADFEYHKSHGAIGTVTAVHPTSRYGEMHIDGDRVIEFNEKPTMADGFASGGFFFFDHRFLSYVSDDPALLLEEEPLRQLARDGQLRHVVHEGFWMGMDTFRDYTALNELWRSGEAPWKVWPDS